MIKSDILYWLYLNQTRSQGTKTDVSFRISGGGCRGNLLQKSNRFSYLTNTCTRSFQCSHHWSWCTWRVKSCICKSNSIASNFSSLHKPLVFSHENKKVTQKFFENCWKIRQYFEKGFDSLENTIALHHGWKNER